MDAPHNLGRYSTGSFTTVQSWDQAGSICALSRSRSQEKGRIEASDRGEALAREPYPEANLPAAPFSKSRISNFSPFEFQTKKKRWA